MFFDIIVYLYIMLIIFLIVAVMHKYVLVVLILLEIIVLTIMMVFFLVFRSVNLEFYVIYYIVFTLCERVLGLTILILIVRYSGNDYYYFFDALKY